MRGRRFLTHVDQLRVDREPVSDLDLVRMLIRATEENFTSWTYRYHLTTDEPGEVTVHVRELEHRNQTRLLAEALEARFDVRATYTDETVIVNRDDLTGYTARKVSN